MESLSERPEPEDTDSDASRTEVEVRRTLDLTAAPDEVWEVLVDDQERAAWFGGPTRLQPAPGGDGWFTDSTGVRRAARVEDIIDERRLSWTWWEDDRGDTDGSSASRVTIDLTPTPSGTRLVVTERPLLPLGAQASLHYPRPASPFTKGAPAPGAHAFDPIFELEHRLLIRAALGAIRPLSHR